jgi:hypothetical protein
VVVEEAGVTPAEDKEAQVAEEAEVVPPVLVEQLSLQHKALPDDWQLTIGLLEVWLVAVAVVLVQQEQHRMELMLHALTVVLESLPP